MGKRGAHTAPVLSPCLAPKTSALGPGSPTIDTPLVYPDGYSPVIPDPDPYAVRLVTRAGSIGDQESLDEEDNPSE